MHGIDVQSIDVTAGDIQLSSVGESGIASHNALHTVGHVDRTNEVVAVYVEEMAWAVGIAIRSLRAQTDDREGADGLRIYPAHIHITRLRFIAAHAIDRDCSGIDFVDLGSATDTEREGSNVSGREVDKIERGTTGGDTLDHRCADLFDLAHLCPPRREKGAANPGRSSELLLGNYVDGNSILRQSILDRNGLDIGTIENATVQCDIKPSRAATQDLDDNLIAISVQKYALSLLIPPATIAGAMRDSRHSMPRYCCLESCSAERPRTVLFELRLRAVNRFFSGLIVWFLFRGLIYVWVDLETLTKLIIYLNEPSKGRRRLSGRDECKVSIALETRAMRKPA